VEQAGGLDAISERHRNERHGCSSFYGIDLRRLEGAIVFRSEVLS